MDLQALFTISHGVYLTGALDTDNRFVGSCIDSVMVVEATPQQIIISLNKGSYTAEVLKKTNQITLSVLPKNTPEEVIQLFGTTTSRNTNKWDQVPHEVFHGLPVYKQAVAYLKAKATQICETSGHFVFLCDVEEGQAGTMEAPLLYADYQKTQAQKKSQKHWRCTVCGYVYQGDIPFEELPEDWLCPLCAQPKSVFVLE